MNAPQQADLFGDAGARPARGGPAPAARVEMEATVVRTRFRNAETGFSVVDVRRTDTGEPDKWVGCMPALQSGSLALAVGTHEDTKDGAQLTVETVAPIMPKTIEGVAEYLCSLGVGIGPKLSAKIVEHFGIDTLAILERSPERLTEVPGVGGKKSGKLVKAWADSRVVGQIMIWLQGHGATPGLATRIYKRYGSRAIELIQENPFRLALDVAGVGFATADAIAKKLGVGGDSPERVQAGVLHATDKRADDGHCYTDDDVLVRAALKVLNKDVDADVPGAVRVTPSQAHVAVQALAHGGHVVREDSAIFPTRLFQAEERVADRVRALLAAPPVGPAPEPADTAGILTALRTGSLDDYAALRAEALARPRRPAKVDPDAVIAGYERQAKITLADEQRAAIRAVAEHKVVVVTGGPGTGKSTITKGIIAVFQALGLDIRLAAPTGRAAKRLGDATKLGAETIHRLLEFSKEKRCFLRDRANPIEGHAIVIDEASMMDLALADSLLGAVPDGARLVIVGDVDQLPSVNAGAVLRDLIESGVVHTVRLTRIFRQAEGSAIIDNAHRINRGERPVGSKDPGGDFFVVDRPEPEAAADLVIHLATERIPRAFGIPARDVRVLSPMRRGVVGTLELNRRMQAAINPEGPAITRGDTVYREGDLVMQLTNDPDEGVYNGDIGTIARVRAEGPKPSLTVDFDGREVDYESSDLGSLQLAYASTVHKLQGGQAPAVVFVMLNGAHNVMLSRNLLYTAVTRAERKVVLVTDPRAIATALRETRREQRDTRLAERLRAGDADARAAYRQWQEDRDGPGDPDDYDDSDP
ncbi:MAG: ATP-dependent RecD-like DNA helicase, partial [Rhodocyclaceae bacterium]